MTCNFAPGLAAEKGWNEYNALIESYQWRKFNGINRAARLRFKRLYR